jgi:hypothetical protein
VTEARIHRSHRVSPGIRLLAVASVALQLLSGCKTVEREPPTISLEQAKKVSATFEGQSFTPPPRTIDDIAGVLDDYELADPKAMERARSKVPRGSQTSRALVAR